MDLGHFFPTSIILKQYSKLGEMAGTIDQSLQNTQDFCIKLTSTYLFTLS